MATESSRGHAKLRARILQGGALAASAAAVLAVAPAASARSAFAPGSVVISGTTYPRVGPDITLGSPLPGGGTAVADGSYPFVFNNVGPDASFGVASPIDLWDVSPFGLPVGQTQVPANQMTTSFSSKSELAINFSTNGRDLTFLGYSGPVDTLDESNSDTPGARDATNPDLAGPYFRVAGDVDQDGRFTFTDANAFSGDNGRAVVLDNATNTYYAAGNSNNGSANPVDVTSAGGLQTFSRSFAPQAFQGGGAPVNQLGLFSFLSTDKPGKDTNFRGLTIQDNVLYTTKGSGSNGTDSVYFVDTTGKACASPNGIGLPQPGAPLPTAAGAPYQMCVLKGFNDLAAKGKTAPDSFPFGIWFANDHTLYVADEGDGVLNATDADPYDDAAAQTGAGLQKWVFSKADQQWELAYTLQDGLGLGQPYTVPGYPTGDNVIDGVDNGPWAPATDGLRNISGQVNDNGTVTIYAVTSTVSGDGDQGADPNKVVAVTDRLDATTPGNERFRTVKGPRFGQLYRGVAVVPGNGHGAGNSRR